MLPFDFELIYLIAEDMLLEYVGDLQESIKKEAINALLNITK